MCSMRGSFLPEKRKCAPQQALWLLNRRKQLHMNCDWAEALEARYSCIFQGTLGLLVLGAALAVRHAPRVRQGFRRLRVGTRHVGNRVHVHRARWLLKQDKDSAKDATRCLSSLCYLRLSGGRVLTWPGPSSPVGLQVCMADTAVLFRRHHVPFSLKIRYLRPI